MLEVYPIQTKEEQIRICNSIGAHFIEDTRAYVAALDEKEIAICQFRLTDESGEILSLDPLPSADQRTLFVLTRATLSFIELCGCKRGSFLPEPQSDGMISAIGFTRGEDGKLSIEF